MAMLLILITAIGLASNPDPSIQTCQQLIDAQKNLSTEMISVQTHVNVIMENALCELLLLTKSNPVEMKN